MQNIKNLKKIIWIYSKFQGKRKKILDALSKACFIKVNKMECIMIQTKNLKKIYVPGKKRKKMKKYSKKYYVLYMGNR